MGRGTGEWSGGAVLIPKEMNINKVQVDSVNGSNELESQCPKLVKSMDQNQVLLSGCRTLLTKFYIVPRPGFTHSL